MPILRADQQMAHRKVKTQADYKRLQASQVRALQEAGQTVAIHVDAAPYLARVDFGRWIIDCVCGAGVAVHPDWSEAYCLGCGGVCTHVVMPPDAVAIEAALAARPSAKHQFFFPDRESLDDLLRENAAHGIGRPEATL